jgi:type IV pilus assembly protein PilE
MRLSTFGRTAGFTLVELVIAVGIVGILAGIAYPSYQEHLYKTRRTEGKGALMRAAQKQESFYSDNKTYADSMTSLGYPADPAVSEKGYYQIRITASSATGYTLQATPQGPQAGDTGCGTLMLNNLGVKARSGTRADCW